jgi:hypothetical protein
MINVCDQFVHYEHRQRLSVTRLVNSCLPFQISLYGNAKAPFIPAYLKTQLDCTSNPATVLCITFRFLFVMNVSNIRPIYMRYFLGNLIGSQCGVDNTKKNSVVS